MNREIMISLTSVQWQDNEKSETELLTKAKLVHENGWDIISYEDSSATGFEGSVTTIKIDKGKTASIIRKGTANTALCLEKGRKHYCQYGTPYGFFQIGVFTHQIKNSIEKDGRIYLKYSIDINSSFISDNEIIMTIQ